ncbi:MAG: protein kinase domain-containing protein, partial [Archangium sp.]
MSGTLAGFVIAETWELESLLGRGGMGEVWLARHRRVEGKQAAIKVMRGLGALNGELLLRFRREAEIAARLEHPNIVQLFDFATLPTGEPYLVMELLRGESLKARVARGPIPWDAFKPLVVQLCSALHVAHQRGVVHRDLKPENIFLVPTPTGDQLKVLDFGISKVMGSDTMQTSNSVLIGTPMYMSPEQAMSNNDELDQRSDVFSLASVMYEALSGKPAFAASGVAQVVHRVAFIEPDPLTNVPDQVWAAMQRALAKFPAQRTPDVATFVYELTGTPLAGAPPTPAPVSTPAAQTAVSRSSNRAPAAPTVASQPALPKTPRADPVQPPAPRSRTPLFAGLGVLVALAAAGAAYLYSQSTVVAPPPVVVEEPVVDAGVPVAVVVAAPEEPVAEPVAEVDAGVA